MDLYNAKHSKLTIILLVNPNSCLCNLMLPSHKTIDVGILHIDAIVSANCYLYGVWSQKRTSMKNSTDKRYIPITKCRQWRSSLPSNLALEPVRLSQQVVRTTLDRWKWKPSLVDSWRLHSYSRRIKAEWPVYKKKHLRCEGNGIYRKGANKHHGKKGDCMRFEQIG